MNTVTQENFADMRSEAIDRAREMQMRSGQYRQNSGNYMMNRTYGQSRQQSFNNTMNGAQNNSDVKSSGMSNQQNMRNMNRNNSMRRPGTRQSQFYAKTGGVTQNVSESQAQTETAYQFNRHEDNQKFSNDNMNSQQFERQNMNAEQTPKQSCQGQEKGSFGDPLGMINDMMGKIFSLVSGDSTKIDKDFLIILLFIIILAKEGADLKLLIALGYILL